MAGYSDLTCDCHHKFRSARRLSRLPSPTFAFHQLIADLKFRVGIAWVTWHEEVGVHTTGWVGGASKFVTSLCLVLRSFRSPLKSSSIFLSPRQHHSVSSDGVHVQISRDFKHDVAVKYCLQRISQLWLFGLSSAVIYCSPIRRFGFVYFLPEINIAVDSRNSIGQDGTNIS